MISLHTLCEEGDNTLAASIGGYVCPDLTQLQDLTNHC